MAEKELLYTQADLDDALKEKADALHAHYQKDYLECRNRAKSAEEYAKKYMDLHDEALKDIKELEGRISRRDGIILRLKAEIYDINKLVSELIKSHIAGADVDSKIADILKKLEE